MTREEILSMQTKLRNWRDSDIGKLFERYDAATGNAWVVDSTSGSPGRMDQAWAAQRKAKAEFLDALCNLAGVDNPYSA